MADPKWAGSASLPAVPTRKVRIGQHSVVQGVLPSVTCRATVWESDIRGHDLVQTDLSPPFDRLLLRRAGARRVDSEMGILATAQGEEPADWPDSVAFTWDSLGYLNRHGASPDEVLDSWRGRFAFREAGVDTPGLRPPQVGALHAISAHFAVGTQFDPATVVLPTGTGKTETMLATLVYRRLGRVLVLVPSRTLRQQIARKFLTLGVLPDLAVVPKDIARPRVAVLSSGLRSLEEAQNLLREANIVVTTPNSLQASEPEALQALVIGCTDLVVDEAHHIAADTWSEICDRFLAGGKRILQFTATPFRQDRKRVDGKIIFNYRLGDAQEADYYRPIHLQTVVEYGGQDARDRAIANAAVAALRRDRNDLRLDHLLMARTSSRIRANVVGAIYRQLAPEFRPVVVYSGVGQDAVNRDALEKLLDRGPQGSRIVVCVDMLGEGFDLPNLKIAALHDTHKSLAITLQFVGRFTRTGNWEQIGEATVIANVADTQTETKLSALYAEGADWDKLIRRLSEDQIGAELQLQDVINGLKESGTLASQLSLWNLRPPLSVQFFRTTCDAWNPVAYRSTLHKDSETWHALNANENILVAVVQRAANVSWGNYQNVQDQIFDLLILHWNPVDRMLAIFSSDYNAFRTDALAKLITDDQTELVSGPPIFNILNNVELPLVKSLGSSRVGAISFTSYFGPNVTEGLASIEKSEAELNNIACLGYEDGERVLWGCTQKKGKVWQVRSGSIAEWLKWVKSTWDKVESEDAAGTNVTRDFLRPQRLTVPHTSHPISAQWGEQVQTRISDNQSLIFGDRQVPVIFVDLNIVDVGADGAITFELSTEDVSTRYRLRIATALVGGYAHEHVAGPTVQFKVGNWAPVDLIEYLMRDPIIVRYADGTYSYNCYHIAPSLAGSVFDKGRLEIWDWTGIPLNQESMTLAGNTDTIQYRTYERIADEFDVIFNDDGPGESADLVCLKDVDERTIRLCLVHCKGAHGGHISQDIRNFYVVCGQAQKNITARHMGLPKLARDLQRRHEAWLARGASRFLKGGMQELTYFKEKARRSKVEFEAILVQPGASAQTITEDSLRLLATTELYLSKTTQATFRVVVSA